MSRGLRWREAATWSANPFSADTAHLRHTRSAAKHQYWKIHLQKVFAQGAFHY